MPAETGFVKHCLQTQETIQPYHFIQESQKA